MQRVLNSRSFIACLLAMATGLVLYFKLPFPGENVFLRVMSVRAPLVYQGTFYSYNLHEAERRLGELDSVLVSEETYLDHARILAPFNFRRSS